MKMFNTHKNIGSAKYVVNQHNGISKHNDGSNFFDIKIFKNKKDLSRFINSLIKIGYKEN
jgi:hypothetical protein